jgi:hypothetical protein
MSFLLPEIENTDSQATLKGKASGEAWRKAMRCAVEHATYNAIGHDTSESLR